MVLCVALVVRGLLFLFQFRPKFGPIPDQLLFYRLCLAPVALPFSCRGGGLAERGKFAVPQRGAGVVLRSQLKSAGPGRFTLPYLPGGLRKTADPSVRTGSGALFSIFFVFFRIEKNVEKTDRQKSTFFALFCDFGSPRRRFLAVFWSQNRSPRLLFRCFFENGDFVKIVLPLRK